MTKSHTRHQNVSKTKRQKYQHPLPNAFRSLPYIQFVAVKSCGEWPSLTYYGPTLDLPLSAFRPKVNTNVQGRGGGVHE